MTMRSVTVRHKGQITLPADIRQKLGLQEGQRLLVEERNDRIILTRPEDYDDPLYGIFKQYAYTINPDPAEERRWVAQHIADTADDYE
jgi:AbrB family looped-hinge helix DNA binding protein